MQKIELGLVALGSVVISLGVSVLYQNNFEAKEVIQKKSASAPDSALEDLHDRLSNLEQQIHKTDSPLDVVALQKTLSSIQDQLTALQDQEEPSTENSTEDGESNYLAEQQQEELEIRTKEHWDSQVYNSQENIQYTDQINNLFANNSEAELISYDCGATACRINVTHDQSKSVPSFLNEIRRLDWVQWKSTTIKTNGEVLMYLSADAALMNVPSIEE